MKAKNIQCGQELEVRVVNANYNDHAVEVQILEGSFKGQRTIVEKSDLVIAKYTVKAECKKYENEDSYKRTLWDSDYHRSLSFELTVTCEDEATQDYIVEKIESYMRKELKEYNFQLSGCPTIENGQYWDCASVDFQHGFMTEIKKDIMTTYKEAKKLLK